jgi:cell division transport system permease protein
MSGSFDKPDGRRNATQPPHDYDLFDSAPTGQATGSELSHHTYDATHHDVRFDEHAAMRPSGRTRGLKRRQSSQGSVVPADSVTGRSLTLVITIMCFLACLTAGAVYMINQSKNAWLNDIASEVTVQVEPKENVDIDKTVADVNAYLQNRSGIARSTPLALDDASKLLEPWLGHSDLLASLPVPRLIAIVIDRDTPPDIDTLRAELTQKFAGVTLDDHRRWKRQIKTVTNSFALGGLAILLLVAAATTAIIISATRSSMASNREIVEVLHFVGATDRYIAREFEKHFLRLGVRAGLVGAVCAMAVFLSMRPVMELMGGGDVTVTEIHRLIGSGGLDVAGYLFLGVVVIIIAALCMLTSRFGVFRILNAKP